MGCLAEVELGANQLFGIACHDPDTGVLTNADSAPIYRVYEEETATPILTGTMTALDAVNTTGFYTELFACSTGNGFEDDKGYFIYIEATVDSDTGGITFSFRVKNNVWSEPTRRLTQSAAAVTATLAGDTITVKRGDTLSVSLTGLGDISASTKLWFSVKNHLRDADTASIVQIDDATGLLYLNATDASARAANGSITVDDAVAGNITIALDEAETDDLVPVNGLVYDVQMLDSSGDVTTLTEGDLDVEGDVTRVIV
jgi:hypothetical protein